MHISTKSSTVEICEEACSWYVIQGKILRSRGIEMKFRFGWHQKHEWDAADMHRPWSRWDRQESCSRLLWAGFDWIPRVLSFPLVMVAGLPLRVGNPYLGVSSRLFRQWRVDIWSVLLAPVIEGATLASDIREAHAGRHTRVAWVPNWLHRRRCSRGQCHRWDRWWWHWWGSCCCSLRLCYLEHFRHIGPPLLHLHRRWYPRQVLVLRRADRVC